MIQYKKENGYPVNLEIESQRNSVTLFVNGHPIDCLKGPYEKTGFALRLYPKGWGVYTGAIQHVSKRNVFAMLDWLHEKQAKPRKDLFNQKEVLYDQNRSHNAGL